MSWFGKKKIKIYISTLLINNNNAKIVVVESLENGRWVGAAVRLTAMCRATARGERPNRQLARTWCVIYIE